MSRGYAPFILDKIFNICYTIGMFRKKGSQKLYFIFSFFLGDFILHPTIITHVNVVVKSFGIKYNFYIF